MRGADRLERGGADLGVGLGGAAEPRERLGAPQPRLGPLHRRVALERPPEQLRGALVVAGQQREQPAVVVGDQARAPREAMPLGQVGLAVAGGARLVVAAEPGERVGDEARHLELERRDAARRCAAPRSASSCARSWRPSAEAMQAAFAQPLYARSGTPGALAGVARGHQHRLGLGQPALGEQREAAHRVEVVAAERRRLEVEPERVELGERGVGGARASDR